MAQQLHSRESAILPSAEPLKNEIYTRYYEITSRIGYCNSAHRL
jgi:hypothetical protein